MSGCSHDTRDVVMLYITYVTREFVWSGAYLYHAKIRCFLICKLNMLIRTLQMD